MTWRKVLQIIAACNESEPFTHGVQDYLKDQTEWFPIEGVPATYKARYRVGWQFAQKYSNRGARRRA